MQQKKPQLLQTVRTAAKLIRNNHKDRFKFADIGIIDPDGRVRDPSVLVRSVMFGRVGDDLVKIDNPKYYIPIDEVPETIRQAFIAYEDARFYRHKGFDPRGILRSVVQNLSGRHAQGASTITMQLARMLFLYHYKRELKYKLAQLYLAILLERHLSKDDILELYLNSLYFANRIYGLETAARFYLGKSARDLSLSESLYLGAISQRPTRTNPLRHPERTEHYRRQRLKYFLRNGLITEAQYQNELNAVPVLRVREENSASLGNFDEIYTVRFDEDTGKFGDNAQTVYERLRAAGLGVPVTAGIMGNLQVESGLRADAGIRFGDPVAIGLAQWDGERLDNLKKTWPDDWQSLDRQIDFLLSEFGIGGAGQKDDRAAAFYNLALADNGESPEYWADVFQALVERNVNVEAYAKEITVPNASGSVTFRDRLPKRPNAYNGRYYLDADRRRNYAKIYAYCMNLMMETESDGRHDEP